MVRRKEIPDWAQQERNSDYAWIQENLHVLWPAAERSYKEQGRGAIVVDTTSRPTGEGNPFYYMDEEGLRAMEHTDALRMARAYAPTWELITMLLKNGGRDSTYRIGVPSAKRQQVIRPLA